VIRRHQDNIWGFVRTIGICLILLAPGGGAGVQAGEPVSDLEIFVRAGCPHCEAAKIFLDDLRRERPAVRIALYDVAEDSAARQRLATLAAERGMTNIGVPTFLIGTELIVGFLSADTTGAEIRARLDENRHSAAPLPIVESIQTKWFGELHVRNLGLPLFTIVIGLLDGFNPCSMWVLIFMLSLLAGLANRPKMLLIAGTFVAVEGIAEHVLVDRSLPHHRTGLGEHCRTGRSDQHQRLLGIPAWDISQHTRYC
jgi:glutaredoxin